MDLLSTLTTVSTKQARRVGRGIGSKKGGHTTGRGNKGDKVRGKTKITFDGTKIKKSWIKRLPFLRGKHRVLPAKRGLTVKLAYIEKHFQAGEVVSLESLAQKLGRASYEYKVLSVGKLTKPLTFKSLLLTSRSKAKIEAAGGKIEA